MNTFGAILILALVCLASAEPPQFRARFLSQRQQLETTTAEWDTTESTTVTGAPYAAAGFKPEQEFNLPTTTDAVDADEEEQAREQTTGPYAPSGWQPSGRLLSLPQTNFRQRQVYEPSTVYGQPAITTESYDQTTAAEASNEFESNETTDEPDSELLPNSDLLNAKLVNAKQQVSQKQEVEAAAPVQQGSFFGNSQPLVYYQFPTNAVGGQVAARLQVQPQAAFVQVPQSAALIQPTQHFVQTARVQPQAAFVQVPQSAALIQQSPAFVQTAARSAAFVQAPLAQPQYFVNPYAYSNAASFSSQYQSSW